MSQARARGIVESLRLMVEARPQDPRIQRILTRLRVDLGPIRAAARSSEWALWLMSRFMWAEYAVLSAWRSDVDEEANHRRQYELTQAIREIGLGYLPVVGRWPSMPTRALFVPLLSREAALDLAHHFDQDVCLWGKAGRTEKVYVSAGGPSRVVKQLHPDGVDLSFDRKCAELWSGRPAKEEDESWVAEQFARLRRGDTIYAPASVRAGSLRAFFWPSSSIFRYLGSKGGEHEVLALHLDRVESGRATAENVGALLALGGRSLTFPTHWFAHVFRLAGYLELDAEVPRNPLTNQAEPIG